jgi:hypothetical protein
MGDSTGSSEDQNVIRNGDNNDCAYKVAGGNKDYWELNWRPFVLHSGKELLYILSVA